MEKFTSRVASVEPIADTSKHVNYSYGMVLGVDDFTQEFAYHSGRDQWMMRDAVGYGTLSGLAVTVVRDGADTEIRVSPGAALTPRGQLVCVSPTQCANVNKWIAFEKNREEIRRIVGRPPVRELPLSVVLCYRDCPTDRVPVPGEPCRTDEEAMAPSRLKDDFHLELRFRAPEQTEEDALRDFIKWLNEHLHVTDEPGAFASLDDLAGRLREAAQRPDSPPSSPPDFMHDAPPTVLRVRTHDAGDFFRAAFRLWVTELRPRWRPARLASYAGCADAPTAGAKESAEDNCVLVADLFVPLNAAGLLDESKRIRIDESRRPYLLHLRLLQEWLLAGTFDATTAAVRSLLPRLTVRPLDTEVRPRLSPLSLRDVVLRTEGVRPAASDSLAEPVGEGAEQPVPEGEAAGMRELVMMREREARPFPSVLPFVSFARQDDDSPSYRLWFHLDAPENNVAVGEFPEGAVSVFRELNEPDEGGSFLAPAEFSLTPVAGRRNLFDLKVASEATRFRAVFALEQLTVRRGDESLSLLDYAARQNVRFVGQDAGNRVTAFAPPVARAQ
jgi:hypothetical protein